MKPILLLIEGKNGDHPSFVAGLAKKGFQVEAVANGNEAVQRLKESHPQLVLINAAAMRTSGRRICQTLRLQAPSIPIVVIISPSGDASRLDANVVLQEPFTLQKLVNRIRPLLPTDQKDVLHAGPLQLDVEQRQFRIDNRTSQLTPRLVALLKALMEHSGEVVERETLFKQVWETTYVEDMRTLDVHISWLRQAVEEDPKHPRYLKTVRGVGYRLDVAGDAFPTARGRKK